MGVGTLCLMLYIFNLIKTIISYNGISLDNVLVVAWSKCWAVYANNLPIKIGNTLICKGWIPLIPLGAIDISCGTATPLDMNYINRSARTMQPYITIIVLQLVHLSNIVGQVYELIFHIHHCVNKTERNLRHSEMEMLVCPRNEQNKAPFPNAKRADTTKSFAL